MINPPPLYPSICKEFETIRETALKVPETTEDITEMISYIEHVKTKGIEELNAKIMVRDTAHCPYYPVM